MSQIPRAAHNLAVACGDLDEDIRGRERSGVRAANAARASPGPIEPGTGVIGDHARLVPQGLKKLCTPSFLEFAEEK